MSKGYLRLLSGRWLYQVITRWHGHQVDALQLSGVSKKRLRAGVQDLIAHFHQLTALERETNHVKQLTLLLGGNVVKNVETAGTLTTEMMSFSFS